jgi:predicted dehydrogenase
MRLGIVGVGVGRFHANTFAGLPGIEVAALADRSPSRLPVPSHVFADHHDARWYDDGFEMIERERLDVVSVCTSPSTHVELVQAAAARGIHVILEKPMATSLDACDAIAAACEEGGVQLHVALPMRALEPVRRLKALLEGGRLGQPAVVSAEYVMGVRPPGHWVWSDAGSSPLNENTCHTIDLLRYLLGDVVDVQADGGSYLAASEHPDGAAFVLRFAGGAVASVVGGAVGVDAFGFAPRVSVHGTEGQAVIDGAFHTYDRLRFAGRGDAAVQEQVSTPRPVAPADVPPFEPYPLLVPALEHILRALRGEVRPLATAEDGRAATAVALAVIERAGTPAATTSSGGLS